MDIDLVYLWCSSSEPNFQKELNQTKAAFFLDNEETERDTRVFDQNELRYSLRSVEKFAPWVHHIYIVTYHQVPEWLDVNHPKITIIDHTQIIPKEYLPTFNSNVIETFLHKIPGLSEYFLFANDDMLFGSKTDPDFFFTAEKLPIQYPHPVKKYTDKYYDKILARSKTLAEKDIGKSLPFSYPYPSHNIDAYTKSLYADTVNHFWNYYQDMLPNKFRKKNDVQRLLISCWGFLTKRLVWRKYDRQNLGYLAKVNNSHINKFLNNPPNLFCLNDSAALDEQDYACRNELLNKLFPKKSAFEKDDKIELPNYQKYSLTPAFHGNNIPIVLVTNEEYIPFCGVCLTSLLAHISEKHNYDIIILTHKGNQNLIKTLIPENLPKNVSIRTRSIAPIVEEYKELFKNFQSGRITKWMKIFLPQLLPNYPKIIFLDSDLLIKCDVAELWDLDLEGKAVGGISDIGVHYIDNPRKKKLKKIFHCDSIDDFINLGVMILDLNTLRQIDFVKKVLKLVKSVSPNAWNLFDLVNITLHQNIKLLPIKYNYQYGIAFKNAGLYQSLKDEVYLLFKKAEQEGSKIVHFTAIKPWQKITGIDAINWWKLARKTDYYEMISLSAITSLSKIANNDNKPENTPQKTPGISISKLLAPIRKIFTLWK